MIFVEDLDKRLNLIELEEKILEFWKVENIYSQIKKKEEGKEVWRFIDGPPYTTGSIHLGTAWNKILNLKLLIHRVMILMDYQLKFKWKRN